MEYSVNKNGSIIEVIMQGKFTISDHDQFRQLLSAQTINGNATLTLDLKGVEFIDSAGIGMLLYANKQSQSKSWALEIRNPTGQVQKMIVLGRLDQVLNVVADTGA